MESVFIECFWQVATACIALIIPILVLWLLFGILHDLFWR